MNVGDIVKRDKTSNQIGIIIKFGLEPLNEKELCCVYWLKHNFNKPIMWHYKSFLIKI